VPQSFEQKRKSDFPLDDLIVDEYGGLENIYEAALSNTPDFVYIIGTNYKFIYANKALLEMWGRNAVDSIGRGMLELGYAPWHADMHHREIDQIVETKQPIRGEVPFTGTLGGRIYEYIFSPIFGKNGDVVAVAGTTRDITDRKEMEEKLLDSEGRIRLALEDLVKARNSAEAANIAKSEFLANMSHEIRTPMNAVVGLANILASTGPLTEKQKEFVKTLQLSADSLLALINDMLDIAKIESCAVNLEKIPFSLADLIYEVADIMSIKIREKNLKFDLHTSCVQGRVFLGDQIRLRQIVMNLLSNAIKFTDNGDIRVGVECISSPSSPVEEIHIKISDTGIGIAPEKLATIFDKFVQADTSINRKYGGTGLGLAITKTLSEMMGGHIEVESHVGQGSTFSVIIPLEVAHENISLHSAGHHYEANQNLETSKKADTHILLVEDYPANILVATSFLEQFGYSYDVATNGQEALEKVKAREFAVILMDVQMHELNGLEATHFIRLYEEEKGRKKTPIIGMTAHALAGDREKCIAAGMSDYIPKPFNPDELQKKLEEAIESKL
jgi:PAS domain S-box-containing protein